MLVDAVRNAISIGGDSDTLGAITGSIAEAYFGIPDGIQEEILSYPRKAPTLMETLERFNRAFA